MTSRSTSANAASIGSMAAEWNGVADREPPGPGTAGGQPLGRREYGRRPAPERTTDDGAVDRGDVHRGTGGRAGHLLGDVDRDHGTAGR